MSHPLLGVKNPAEGVNSHVWQLDFTTPTLAYLKDHAFRGMPIMPGAAYVEVGLAGIKTLLGNVSYRISNISFDQVLLLSENTASPALVLTKKADKVWDGRVVSGFSANASESHQQLHSHFTIEADFAQKPHSGTVAIEEIRSRCTEEYPGTEIYKRFNDNSNEYGPTFQNIANLYLGDRECLASLRLHSQVEADMYHYHVHPSILDSCVQALASIDFSNAFTYVLSHIEEITINQFPSKVGWIHAVVTNVDQAGTVQGTIQLFDASKELVLEMKGVTLKYLLKEDGQADSSKEKNKMVVAATFTAEPVEASLNYWMDTFNTPTEISFSPYNQIFQELLNPGSLLSSNTEGVNILMLRFGDWAHRASSLNTQVDEDKKARLLSQRDHHTLPNQLKVAHLNQYETEYLYKEIFEDQTYLKHGIEIPPNACVVDVGANIGMFTLFVLDQAPDATVYSFEPSPPAFEALSINASLYGKNVVPFNMGLSDTDGEATFTFYNNSSVFSSFHADQALDKAAIQTVVENALVQTAIDQSAVGVFTEELMENRLQKQTFPCQLRKLSTIIDEEGIDTIDLLKVDVEKSELYVLRGIRDEHWAKVRQIVIEVHDTVGDVIAEVTDILKRQGFNVVIEEEDLLKESGLFNLYGRRTEGALPETKEQPLKESKAVLERNITDLAQSLGLKQQKNNTPCIVVACPESPEVLADEQAQALYAEAETLLAAQLQAVPNTFLIQQKDIFSQYPVEQYYDQTGQELGDVPYSPAFFSAIGTSIARKIRSISRKPYKVIVLDCDNTLWQGVVGDTGPQGIDISPAHKALQSFMIKQQEAGMLLCLCSKNMEEDVLAVFDSNENMVLNKEHIVAHRINWNAKSENILSLAEELDLGLDSFIFIDDNPVECAEVQSNCPEVLTLQLPADASHIESFLDHVWAFDHLTITTEDRKRTLLYQQNIRRSAYQKESLTFASFIDGLKLQIDIQEPAENQIPRLSQLTQRTNQFNFTTKRRSEAEVKSWLASENNHGLIVSVTDRFGDYGIVGALLYAIQEQTLVVDSYILSCRVLGKGVEHTMLRKLGAFAQSHGLQEVHIPYAKTKKNLPALRFLQQASQVNLEETGANEHTFVFTTEQAISTAFDPDATSPKTGTDSKQGSSRTRSQKASLVPLQDIAAKFRHTEDILKAVQEHILRARPEQTTAFIAPGKKMEQSIASIWQEVLGIDQVGIHDNFFEIGGTSLRAVQVISKLRSQLDVEISLINMFEKPNIKALASLLEGDSETATSKASSASRQRGEQRRANRTRRGRQRKS